MSASARAESDRCRTIGDAPLPALDVARMFREHRAMVERALRRSGVAEVDLADARQEVFIVVHRRLAQFEARSSVTTWLYGIAYHVACDFRRRAARRQLRSSALDAEPAADADSARAIEQRDALLRALRAIDRLRPERREVFVLHELCELPMREVAARLRCPLKTAFSRLYAARRALLAELGDAGMCAALPPWSWQTPSRIARALELRLPAQLQAWKAGAALASAFALCVSAPAREDAPPRAPVAHVAATPPAPLARTLVEAPPLQAPAVSAAQSGANRSPRRATARARPELAAAAPASALARAEELDVFRASAVDLRPVGWNPFAAEFAAPAAPLRVRVIGEVRAASSVELAFAATDADDFDL